MSLYQLNPSNKQILQATPGYPNYLLGSLNKDVASTRMQITSVSLAGTTGTVTGVVIEGQIPVVGQLVYISGAVPAYFNVNSAVILSVSAAAVPDVGVYTITFTLANTSIATTNSPGLLIAPQVETGELLSALSVAGGVFYSRELGLPSNTGPNNGRTIRADVSFPVLPGAATVALQTAEHNVDSEYKDLFTVGTVAGGVLTGGAVWQTLVVANFVRFRVYGIVGIGSSSIVGKVTI
jgi:hypothetical protein